MPERKAPGNAIGAPRNLSASLQMRMQQAMKREDVDRALKRIKSNDPIEAMEAAKALIAGGAKASSTRLSEVAVNERLADWSRISAIYALGLLNDLTCERLLMSILADCDEARVLREHAAEALGNLRSPRAVGLLRMIALSDQRPTIKKWCVYALGEISGSRALSALQDLAAEHPSGTLEVELNDTLKQVRMNGRRSRKGSRAKRRRS